MRKNAQVSKSLTNGMPSFSKYLSAILRTFQGQSFSEGFGFNFGNDRRSLPDSTHGKATRFHLTMGVEDPN